MIDIDSYWEELKSCKEMKEKKERNYKVLYSKGPDFILNHTKDGQSETLVCIFSKKQFFLGNDDTLEKIENPTEEQLQEFFRDREEFALKPDEVESGYVKKGIRKDDLYWFQKIQMEEKPYFRFLIQENAISFFMSVALLYFRNIRTGFDELYEKNPSFLSEAMKTYFGKEDKYEDCSFYICLINEFYDVFGEENARYLIHCMEKSPYSISLPHDKPEQYKTYVERIAKYYLDEKDTLNYLFFDTYRQGYTKIPYARYCDFLDLQFQEFGEIKNPYPEDLESQQMILSAKDEKKKYLKNNFSLVYYQGLSDFNYSNSSYLILSPVGSHELVEEDLFLHNGVSDLVKNMMEGNCVLVFFRKKEEPDIPYITIEILQNRMIAQILGENKNNILCEEEKLFLRKWAKEKNLIFSENVI